VPRELAEPVLEVELLDPDELAAFAFALEVPAPVLLADGMSAFNVAGIR
jgi:hypothetical protein